MKYKVNWSDASFPTITKCDPDEPVEGQTFLECKREIIDHFQCQLDHARDRISAARALRVKDL